MSNFMGVGIFWIGLNRDDLGCWRMTLIKPTFLDSSCRDISNRK